MHFAYLDEAGNTGQNLLDPDAPLHLIGALLVPEDKITLLGAAVDEIVAAYRNMLALPADAELHGVELAAGKGVFKNRPVAARLEILEAVAKLPAKLGLDVYFRGVDKARLSSRYSDPYHPHDISLMFMIESIEARAKRLASSDGHCRVLLVADEIKDRSGVIVRDVSSYQQTGTAWGWKSTGPLEHIVDTIHFVSSRTNRGVQVADCLTWIALRVLRMKRDKDPIAPDAPFNVAIRRIWGHHVEPQVRALNIWLP